MDKQKLKEQLSNFIQLLYQKGYRGHFNLLHPGTGHPGMTGSLRACLEKFITGYELTHNRTDKFQLNTQAHNNNDITCIFQLRYDQGKGFLIKELNVKDALSKQNKVYRISANQQVPGAVAVQGLFPKSKPWDRILKGKFRPGRS